jgi:hypothetical protein
MDPPAAKKPKTNLPPRTPGGLGTSSFTVGTTLTPGASGISFFNENTDYDYSTVCLLIMPTAI